MAMGKETCWPLKKKDILGISKKTRDEIDKRWMKMPKQKNIKSSRPGESNTWPDNI